MKLRVYLAAVFAILVATPAYAHTGVNTAAGFMVGFVHPISGLDHILAMVAVGIFATQLESRAVWLVPMAFISMMVVGAVIGITGLAMPFVELGIIGSVIILGLVVAIGKQISVSSAMIMVGLLAVFHGYAHGAEMLVDFSGIAYGLGFALSTLLLHFLGIGFGIGAQRVSSSTAPIAVRISGGGIALAGLGLISTIYVT